jgi:RNA polymerase sigma factor (TIGR02999 family)
VSDVTRLLDAVERGEPQAAEDLLPLVYEELRRLAAYRLGQEKPGQTLQATALVHEAYLRLVKGNQDHWKNRKHFFGAAAEAMRRILIEKARRRRRLANGGYAERVAMEAADVTATAPPEELLALHEALDEFSRVAPETAELVKLRYFVGLTHSQAAEILGVSRRRADSMWVLAKGWLYRALQSETPSILRDS